MAKSIKDIVPGIMDRQVELVDWPGTEEKVGLLVLREDERQEAHTEARARYRKRGLEKVDQTSLQAFLIEEEVQQCYRLLIDPESKLAKDRLFASADDARRGLEPEQREYFIDKWMVLRWAKAKALGTFIVDDVEDDE